MRRVPWIGSSLPRILAVLVLAGALIAMELAVEARPADPPPAIDAGKPLIANLGCPVCHEIAGHETTVRGDAPDLSYEGELLRPGWLFAFLKSPSRIRPFVKARMPDFRLADEEALAITEYLVSLKDGDAPHTEAGGADLPADLAEIGRKLASKDYFDCFKCHLLADSTPGGDPSTWAPDLSRAGARFRPEGIVSWIRNPPRYRPNTKMPVFFPDQDSGPEDILGGDEEKMIAALRSFVLSLSHGEADEAYIKTRAAFPDVGPPEGRSLMVKLNCVGCHNVAWLPDGKRVGPSLNAEGSRVTPTWLSEFLKRPRTIKPEYAIMGSFARMPDFRLNDEEVKTLTEYVSANLLDAHASLPPESVAAPGLKGRGERLFEEKRCNNCHRIGLRAGGIGPNLTEAERRLAPGWVYRFILNPSHYLETRMPDLHVSEDDARAITAYLMSPKEP